MKRMRVPFRPLLCLATCVLLNEQASGEHWVVGGEYIDNADHLFLFNVQNSGEIKLAQSLAMGFQPENVWADPLGRYVLHGRRETNGIGVTEFTSSHELVARGHLDGSDQYFFGNKGLAVSSN